MFMGPTDMKKYPKTTQFIQGIEGTLKGQPKIRNAFLEACVADDQDQSTKVAEKLAKEKALRWATGPRVDVHEGLIRPPVQGEIVDACGFTDTFGLHSAGKRSLSSLPIGSTRSSMALTLIPIAPEIG